MADNTKDDLKVVRVTWRDAEDLSDTWADDDRVTEFAENDSIMESVGYVVRRTDKYLTIAGDWDAKNGNWGTVRKLPTAMVLNVEELSI